MSPTMLGILSSTLLVAGSIAFFLIRRLLRGVQVRGVRFLGLQGMRFMQLVQGQQGIELPWGEWHVEGINAEGPRLMKMTRLAVMATDARVRLRRGRLFLDVQSISIIINPKRRGEEGNGASSKPRSANLPRQPSPWGTERLITMLAWLARACLRLVGCFWCVRVGQVKMIFTQLPADEEQIDYWTALEIALSGVGLFYGGPGELLRVEQVRGSEHILRGEGASERADELHREILKVPPLSLLWTMAPRLFLRLRHTCSEESGNANGSENEGEQRSICVDLWPSTLLLLTSALATAAVAAADNIVTEGDDQLGSSTGSPPGRDTTDSGVADCDSIKMVILSRLTPLYMDAELGCLSVSLHLPVAKEEMRRFESLNIDAARLRARLRVGRDSTVGTVLQSRLTFLYALTCGQVTISSTAANTFGSMVISKMQRLFEGALGSPQGRRETFLTGTSLILANCYPSKDQRMASVLGISVEDMSDWVGALIKGTPVWGAQEGQSQHTGNGSDRSDRGKGNDPSAALPTSHQRTLEKFTSHISEIIPILPDFFPALSAQAEGAFTFAGYDRFPDRSTIYARLASLSFDVPYEYPLSNLFDHLAFFIKIVQTPLARHSDRQDFNLFAPGIKWRLLVQADQAAFNIGDGPFEVRLGKCLHVKRGLYRKLERMERLFWERSQSQDQGQRGGGERGRIEEGWVPGTLRQLANAAEHPERLRRDPYLIKRYVRLHELFFTMYKAHIRVELPEEVADLQPLLHVGVANINFSIRWDDCFTHTRGDKYDVLGGTRGTVSGAGGDLDDKCNWSMCELLASIEGDDIFTDEEVCQFGVFLGGFVDVSAENLSVTLRDYAVPLCHAEAARLLGLVFLIEEPSYANAKSVNLVEAVWGQSPSGDTFKPGKWNLQGLDEQRRVRITRTILPLKIYHSLQIALLQGPSDEDARRRDDDAGNASRIPHEWGGQGAAHDHKCEYEYEYDQSVLAGFSPLMEGAFQMLDRAFELFSKPSEELSPFLPFWDKLRLLLRGTSSSLLVRTTCRVVILGGTDLHSDEEAISVIFPQGLTLGLDGSRIRLKAPKTVVYLNSQEESLLRWLHRTTGAPFHRTDQQMLTGVAKGRDDDLPIIIFPSLDLQVTLESYGLGQMRPVPHNAIRLCAASAGSLAPDAGYDSYRFFRIHRLMVSIEMRTLPQESRNTQDGDDSKLLLFYYRELESWAIRAFSRFVTPPVMPGPLFEFGTLGRKATPKLLSVLSDVRLHLAYEGLFCVRGLQYYDTASYGGAILSSQGRTRITLAWHKGEQIPSGTNPPTISGGSGWACHFAEYDFSTMRLGIIGSMDAIGGKRSDGTAMAMFLISKDFPLTYPGGVAIYEVLTAPRMFYIIINEGAFFRGDSESRRTQQCVIEEHLSELAQEIDSMAVRLRQCDPHEDLVRFSGIKRELTVLLEQNEYISKFVHVAKGERKEGALGEGESVEDDRPERPLVNNHHIIIQNARLVWHRLVRDAVFSLVDQQFQFFRCAKATVYEALRSLEWAGEQQRRRSHPHEHARTSSIASSNSGRRISSPFSPGSPTSTTEAFFETLMTEERPLEVEHEDLEEKCEADGGHQREEQLGDPVSLHGDGAFVSFRLDVNFVSPQIILVADDEEAASTAMSNTGEGTDRRGTRSSRDSPSKSTTLRASNASTVATTSTSSAIIVTAQSAGLKYGTVRQREHGEIVGRRTKIVLENALFHGAFRRDFSGTASWPPSYPVEYLLSRETEAERFKRLSERVRVTFVYDVSNKRLSYTGGGLSSPVRSLFGQGDKLRVDAGAISLLTTSDLYAALYSVIVNLLVYRDPTQKMRSEQLESLALTTNLFNQTEISDTIADMQQALVKRRRCVEGSIRRVLRRGGRDQASLMEEYARLKGPWDELALVLDAMHTVRATQNKMRQRQTRLLLDVALRKIQWTLLLPEGRERILALFSLDGIHNSWLSAEDGCQSNLIEIRSLKALNRLPDAFYKTLIASVPEEIKALLHSEHGFRGIGTQGNAVRFFFKARPPVGGIRIVEHFELNLSPLQFQLTYDIVEELIKFFFPERRSTTKRESRDESTDGVADEDILEASTSELSEAMDTFPSSMTAQTSSSLPSAPTTLIGEIKSGIKTTASSFISRFGDRIDDHDVELMKARAADNLSFIYITVPASQHLISYKGRGESSITDVEGFILRLPDFEYHSQILSWLELFLKLRRDSISVVLSNVGALVKDKIKRFGQANVPETDEGEAGPLARTASRLLSSASVAAATKTKEKASSKETQVCPLLNHPTPTNGCLIVGEEGQDAPWQNLHSSKERVNWNCPFTGYETSMCLSKVVPQQ